MKDLEKVREKKKKKRSRDTEQGDDANVGGGSGVDVTAEIMNNPSLSPLERLHIAQQNKLNGMGGGMKSNNTDPLPIINLKNKCVPGMLDLPGIVDKVSRAATQLAHSGGGRSLSHPSAVSSGGINADNGENSDTIPIVFIAENAEIMIAMIVEGITCAHCVKIVETVLRGCNGNKSPIDGLIDAAADRTMNAILIRIDRVMNARRVSLEATRNLAMVGYTAHVKTMSTIVEKNGTTTKIPKSEIERAFETMGAIDPSDIFDWSAPCSCPDNGVARDDCLRHGQMNNSLLDAFETRAIGVRRYISGDIPQPLQKSQLPQQMMMNYQFQQQGQQGVMMNDIQPLNDASGIGMDLFGGTGGMNNLVVNLNDRNGGSDMRGSTNNIGSGINIRNAPVLSFGDHRMSLTGQMSQNPNNRMSLMGRMSEISYGRAMSGLSALSIDWENMDGFDINVDHSEHINNSNNNHNNHNMGAAAVAAAVGAMGRGNRGSHAVPRSSLRHGTFHNNGGVPNVMDSDAQVQFKI